MNFAVRKMGTDLYLRDGGGFGPIEDAFLFDSETAELLREGEEVVRIIFSAVSVQEVNPDVVLPQATYDHLVDLTENPPEPSVRLKALVGCGPEPEPELEPKP